LSWNQKFIDYIDVHESLNNVIPLTKYKYK